LLHITGILEIGTASSALVQGTLNAARRHALPHDILDAAALMRRFPAFRVPSDFVAVLQPDGGFLEAEPALVGLLALAREAGAIIRTSDAVRAIGPRASGVRVVTDHDVIDARAVIVTAGARVTSLLPDLPVRLRVTRQVLAWFEPREEALFSRDRCPVFMIEGPHGFHYGFPMHPGLGVKIGKHHHLDEEVDPDRYDRAISTRDEAAIRAALEDYVPAANGKRVAATTCLYTRWHRTVISSSTRCRLCLRSWSGHPAPGMASSSRHWSAKFSPISQPRVSRRTTYRVSGWRDSTGRSTARSVRPAQPLGALDQREPDR
jgi:sarcosine oxidase